MSDEQVMVRIPKRLVERAAALWDVLLQDPKLRAAGSRRSAAAAVRLLLEAKVSEIESHKRSLITEVGEELNKQG